MVPDCHIFLQRQFVYQENIDFDNFPSYHTYNIGIRNLIVNNFILDTEVSVQIEEEEEVSSISTPVKDVPIVSKSEPNEEWIPMEEMKQSEATGKTEYAVT